MKKWLIISVMLLSSCTVSSDREKSIRFDSNEKDVKIYINGEKHCVTPCITQVPRSRNSLIVVAKKDGFDDYHLTVPSSVKSSVFYITMEHPPKNIFEKQNLERQRRIRAFVLENYSQMKMDTFTESKEYLFALSHMTGIPLAKLEQMTEDAKDEAALANDIVDLYKKK